MNFIKLKEVNSTNTYLKNKSRKLDDFTFVWTLNQTEGRGQRENKWESENGKNLTFSVLKKFEKFKLKNYFLLNIMVSLSVFQTLKELNVMDLWIKWPNDIYCDEKKICGILIENNISGSYIKESVIGIGINVNQSDFGELKATSLKNVCGKGFEIEEILNSIAKRLVATLEIIENMETKDFIGIYEKYLYKINKVSVFKDKQDKFFVGIIRGVSVDGRLKIEIENEGIKYFFFKEVKMF